MTILSSVRDNPSCRCQGSMLCESCKSMYADHMVTLKACVAELEAENKELKAVIQVLAGELRTDGPTLETVEEIIERARQQVKEVE